MSGADKDKVTIFGNIQHNALVLPNKLSDESKTFKNTASKSNSPQSPKSTETKDAPPAISARNGFDRYGLVFIPFVTRGGRGRILFGTSVVDRVAPADENVTPDSVYEDTPENDTELKSIVVALAEPILKIKLANKIFGAVPDNT